MRANIGPDLEKLLDPADYLGSTGDIIAAALRRHARGLHQPPPRHTRREAQG